MTTHPSHWDDLSPGEGTLDWHFATMKCQEYTFTVGENGITDITMHGPDLVDVNDTTTTVCGELHLDLDTVFGAETARTLEVDSDLFLVATEEQALEGAITTLLTHHMHEIVEWFTYDDELVFASHGPDSYGDFEIMARLARTAAAAMLRELPRNRRR